MSKTVQSKLNEHYRIRRRPSTKCKLDKENETDDLLKKPHLVVSDYVPKDPNEKYVHVDTPRPPKRSNPFVTQDNCEASSNGNGFKQARRALHSSTPSSLPGREVELNEMQSFLEEHLEHESSGALYVSGQPGTGKTASLNYLLTNKNINSKFTIVSVNCSYLRSSSAIYARICEELSLKVSQKSEREYLTKLKKYLTSDHPMILLILDEIDQLETKKQNVLYAIFEWPSLPNAKLVLIGIANALDLTDRVLPRLQANIKHQPQLLHFAPYSKDQIANILSTRLEEGNVKNVLSGNALNLLAAKVAAVSGDIRKALDVARSAVDLAENKLNSSILQPCNDNASNIVDNNSATPAVDMKEVLSVINSIYGNTSQVLSFVGEEEECIPLQQKLVLCSLLLMMEHSTKKLDITVGKLYEVFRKICTKQRVCVLDQSEFLSICDLIEVRGILRIHGKAHNRQSKITLQWDKEEMLSALQDKILLSSILADKTILYDK